MNVKRAFFPLCVLLFFCWDTVFAQVQSSISEKSLSIENDFSIEVYNSESGLPQNSIVEILQTSNGYLWLSTFSGLVRFDGVKFTSFNSVATLGLLSNTVMVMHEDKNKNLWLLDDLGHLIKYDGSIFTGFEKSFGNIKIRSFCFSEDGTLFVATTNNEIYTVNGNIIDFVSRINQNTIKFIKPGKNNSILIATSGGLFELKNSVLEINAFIPKTEITCLAFDAENFMWVSTIRGLYKVSSIRSERIALPDENELYLKIFIDRQNRKWIYNGADGIYVLGINDFTQINEESGLSSNDTRIIFQDAEDNIWVGTNGSGLNKLHYKIFKTFSVEDGLISEGVAPILKSSDGSVYVGNNCGGINKIIEGKIIKKEIPKQNICVWSMLEVNDDNLWIGTYGGGLFRYKNDVEQAHYNRLNGLTDEVIVALYQDKSGTIWIGTDKSVFTYDGDSIKPYKREIIKSKISYFLQDSSKNFWIGTNNGLYKIIENNVELFTTYNGLPANSIRALYADADQTLWIGTMGGGFCRYRDGKFSVFKNIPELSTIDVFCIAEDEQQNFWFTTNRGIYSVKKYDLNNFADHKSATVSFRYFDRKDGLKTNEFNSGFQPNFLKEDGTHFWFPSIKGVAILNTRRILSNDYIPQITIEKVVADDNTFSIKDRITLSLNTSTIEIHYTAPRFNNTQKTYFQYKLEGFDTEWHQPTTDMLARYFSLKPGSYEFKVRIYGIFGTEKSISIQVPLPYWKTNWFLVLCYVTGIALLALFAYLRIRHIRRQEKNKTALNKKLAEFELKALQAQMNPHFLFNCLNTIKYFITTSNHTAANKYLTKFSKLLRMFLDHSTSNTISLEDEINLLRLYIELEQMRFDEGFNFHLQVDDSIDYKNIEIPATLFQPFVENAINHGLVNLNRKGNLTIIFEQKNGAIKGIIDDDGIGRSESAKRKTSMATRHVSRGTQLIDDRIKTLNYIRAQAILIEIIDKEDALHNSTGTRVEVTIPI